MIVLKYVAMITKKYAHDHAKMMTLFRYFKIFGRDHKQFGSFEICGHDQAKTCSRSRKNQLITIDQDPFPVFKNISSMIIQFEICAPGNLN